ncbi:MAG: HAD-IA family hydrolase [Spirochaetaceae bacterium]|jgi:putative hydrolase of the HAD superfamily|nr:HAD-IA family hydrolase [Spirochaetaceae bacterium]
MIRYILFDLDNTLYSIRTGMEQDFQRRIIAFTSRLLGVTPEKALSRRREGITRYGTTLEWLIGDEGFTAIDEYYAAVHPPGEEDCIPPDPELRRFLLGLNIPLAILTNSPREHTDRVLAKIGIADLFTHIFDMRWNGNQGKPLPIAFTRALDALGSATDNTLFIDDAPHYVQGYLDLGGRGILRDEFDRHPDYPYPKIRELTELTRYL